MTDAVAPITRMGSDERRELVLKAATSVFGQRGYSGTTTDAVAAAAGVSQPYVVRIFGTKEKLFLAVLQRALELLLTAFRTALSNDSEVPVERRVSLAYVDLLRDRGLLLSLMHGFVLGTEPEIGRVARSGFLDVYRFLKNEAGFTPAVASDFLAHGMLMNTLVGLRMTDEFDTDVDARELLEGALQTKLELLMEVTDSPAPQVAASPITSAS
jgi:TetR/AcrR family transcriptional regulator